MKFALNSFTSTGGTGSTKEEEKGTGKGLIPDAETNVNSSGKPLRRDLERECIHKNPIVILEVHDRAP